MPHLMLHAESDNRLDGRVSNARNASSFSTSTLQMSIESMETIHTPLSADEDPYLDSNNFNGDESEDRFEVEMEENLPHDSRHSNDRHHAHDPNNYHNDGDSRFDSYRIEKDDVARHESNRPHPPMETTRPLRNTPNRKGDSSAVELPFRFQSKIPVGTIGKRLQSTVLNSHSVLSANLIFNRESKIFNHNSKLEKLMEPTQPQPIPDDLDDQYLKYAPTNVESLGAFLAWRAIKLDKKAAFVALNKHGKPYCTVSFGNLYRRSLRIAFMLTQKLKLVKGSEIVLLYQQGDILNFSSTLFACFLCGVVAVPISSTMEWELMKSLIEGISARVIVTTGACMKVLKKKMTGNLNRWDFKMEWLKTDG